jgi:type IV secretory pathway VirB2 component (pilin)
MKKFLLTTSKFLGTLTIVLTASLTQASQIHADCPGNNDPGQCNPVDNGLTGGSNCNFSLDPVDSNGGIKTDANFKITLPDIIKKANDNTGFPGNTSPYVRIYFSKKALPNKQGITVWDENGHSGGDSNKYTTDGGHANIGGGLPKDPNQADSADPNQPFWSNYSFVAEMGNTLFGQNNFQPLCHGLIRVWSGPDTSPGSSNGDPPGSGVQGNGFGPPNTCSNNTLGVQTPFGCLQSDPAQLINEILRIVLGVAGGLAVLFIIIGGYKVAASQGDPDSLDDGRDMITKAVIGLVFVLLATFILGIIGVDILGIKFFHISGGTVTITQ